MAGSKPAQDRETDWLLAAVCSETPCTGFSKKLEDHAASVALYFMHYNFARIHRALRITPATAAGVADHVWGLEEIVGLLDAADKKAA